MSIKTQDRVDRWSSRYAFCLQVRKRI